MTAFEYGDELGDVLTFEYAPGIIVYLWEFDYIGVADRIAGTYVFAPFHVPDDLDYSDALIEAVEVILNG